MFKVTESKSGLPNLVVGNINLHSPYDPLKESRRFVASHLKDKRPACIILLGAALDCVTGAIHASSPESRLIPIFFHEQVFRYSVAYRRFPDTHLSVCWHPGTGRPLSDFLKEQLNEPDLEGLEILEWKPSSLAFPDAAHTVKDTLHKVITELRSNLVTTGVFGRLWLRNTVANFIALDSVIKSLPAYPQHPVVIAASGPSLERAVVLLKPQRHLITLWALPSSVPLLLAHNLLPDLVIVTDPGYYSIMHLQPLKEKNIAIACPLSAARGLSHISEKIFLLRQPHFFEEAFLKKSMRVLPPLLPPQGTVAATALQLALTVTEREIIFCGLDFCYADLKAHALPNVNHRLCQFQETRLHPVYDQMFKLVHTWGLPEEGRQQQQVRHTSIPLLAYADWFSRLAASFRTRLFRLLPSAVSVESLTALDESGFKRLLTAYPSLPAPLSLERDLEYPVYRERVQTSLLILGEWEKMVSDKLAALKNKSWQEQLSLLTGDPLLLDFLYFYDPAALLNLRKELRLLGELSDSQKPVRLLEKVQDFIGELMKKVRD